MELSMDYDSLIRYHLSAIPNTRSLTGGDYNVQQVEFPQNRLLVLQGVQRQNLARNRTLQRKERRRGNLPQVLLQTGGTVVKKKHHNKHYKGRNYHHLTPKSRGGGTATSNLLLIDIDRHRTWHRIFGNKTLGEVIDLLIRLEKAKAAQQH